MELIVISNPVAVADESILINNLFEAGLQCFHIRKPESDVRTVRELIGGIAPLFYNRISLHQFHEIAPDYGIQRLHYTEHYRAGTSPKNREVQKANGYILSTSVHDATLLPGLTDFDYVFFGPVFNSLSKSGYQSTLTTDFKLKKNEITTKVIALGGVDQFNLIKIEKMGFDGAAVLGAIWNAPSSAVASFLTLSEIYTPQNITS